MHDALNLKTMKILKQITGTIIVIPVTFLILLAFFLIVDYKLPVKEADYSKINIVMGIQGQDQILEIRDLTIDEINVTFKDSSCFKYLSLDNANIGKMTIVGESNNNHMLEIKNSIFRKGVFDNVLITSKNTLFIDSLEFNKGAEGFLRIMENKAIITVNDSSVINVSK